MDFSFFFENLSQINFSIMSLGILTGILSLLLALELIRSKSLSAAHSITGSPHSVLVFVTVTGLFLMSLFASLAQLRALIHEFSLLITLLCVISAFALWMLSLYCYQHIAMTEARKRVFVTLVFPLFLVGMNYMVSCLTSPYMINRVVSGNLLVLYLITVLLWCVFRQEVIALLDIECKVEISQFLLILKLVGLNLFVILGTKLSTEYVSSLESLPNVLLPLSYSHFSFIASILTLGLVLLYIGRVYLNITTTLSDTEERLNSVSAQLSEQKRQNKLSKSMVEAKTRRIELLEESQVEEELGKIDVGSLVSAVITLDGGLFEWDLEKDTVIMSRDWISLLGFAEDEVCGQGLQAYKWRRGFLDHDLSFMDEQIQLLISGKATIVRFQARYEEAGGDLLKIEFKIAAVKNAYGLICKLVGLMEDRTADMLVEERIRKNLSEDFKITRRKSEFVDYLSHEIRTPMTIIASASALIEAQFGRETFGINRTKDYLAQIQSAVASLRALVDQTLIFIGSDKGDFDDHDVQVVCVRALFDEVLKVESSRRSKSMPDDFEIRVMLNQDESLAISATLLTHVFRPFICFVFDNPKDVKSLEVGISNSTLYVQAVYAGLPDWISLNVGNRNVLGPALRDVPVEDDSLPFALLLSKRVIRNLKGRLILKVCDDCILLKVELPVEAEEVCLK